MLSACFNGRARNAIPGQFVIERVAPAVVRARPEYLPKTVGEPCVADPEGKFRYFDGPENYPAGWLFPILMEDEKGGNGSIALVVSTGRIASVRRQYFMPDVGDRPVDIFTYYRHIDKTNLRGINGACRSGILFNGIRRYNGISPFKLNQMFVASTSSSRIDEATRSTSSLAQGRHKRPKPPLSPP